MSTHNIYRTEDGYMACTFYLAQDPDMYFDITPNILYVVLSPTAENELRKFLCQYSELTDDTSDEPTDEEMEYRESNHVKRSPLEEPEMVQEWDEKLDD